MQEDLTPERGSGAVRSDQLFDRDKATTFELQSLTGIALTSAGQPGRRRRS